MDELAILKYLGKLQDNGEVGEVFIRVVSNRDIDAYVTAPNSSILGTIVKIESALYIKRELDIMSVNRKNNTIKALTNRDITVFIKVITPEEAKKLRSNTERTVDDD